MCWLCLVCAPATEPPLALSSWAFVSLFRPDPPSNRAVAVSATDKPRTPGGFDLRAPDVNQSSQLFVKSHA